MTEMAVTKDSNVLFDDDKNEESFSPPKTQKQDVTLYLVFVHLIESIFSEGDVNGEGGHLRVKKLLIDTLPMFREAVINTRRDLLVWTRAGSPFRAILVISAGIASVLGLTGMLGFMIFVVAATVNAIVISLLISFSAVGGFLAIIFACLTATYISVLLIAAFVTFTITISSIIAALVAAGWIGFFWITWLAVSNSASLAKRIAGQANASGQQNTRNI